MTLFFQQVSFSHFTPLINTLRKKPGPGAFPETSKKVSVSLREHTHCSCLLSPGTRASCVPPVSGIHCHPVRPVSQLGILADIFPLVENVCGATDTKSLLGCISYLRLQAIYHRFLWCGMPVCLLALQQRHINEAGAGAESKSKSVPKRRAPKAKAATCYQAHLCLSLSL